MTCGISNRISRRMIAYGLRLFFATLPLWPWEYVDSKSLLESKPGIWLAVFMMFTQFALVAVDALSEKKQDEADHS